PDTHLHHALIAILRRFRQALRARQRVREHGRILQEIPHGRSRPVERERAGQNHCPLAPPSRSALRRAFASRADSINSNSLFGLSGISMISTPKSDKASSTACANSAPVGMHPASPTPLRPTGLNGDGVSRCAVSIGGTSVAVGIR